MSEAVEVLISEIRKRAEKEIQETIKSAEERAKNIIEEAKRKVDKLFMDRARAEVALIRRRIIGRAEVEGRTELLKAKEEIVEKVLDGVLNEIKKVASGERRDYNYEKIFYSLLKEAVSNIREDTVVIHANQKDLEYIKRNLRVLEEKLSRDVGRKINLKIGRILPRAIGGVVAESEDGLKTYYNTLEDRVFKMKRKLRLLIGKVLFSQEL